MLGTVAVLTTGSSSPVYSSQSSLVIMKAASEAVYMARSTTAKSAHTEAMKRAVKALGQSMLTGAWKSRAHTSQ